MVAYLVIGATGQVGGAVVNSLLETGATVHAVVRDLEKDAAQKLKAQGVKLFQGDNDDAKSFEEASKGCKGLFINLMPSPDLERETRQAHDIIEAVKGGGVDTIVASTVFFTEATELWDNDFSKSLNLWAYYHSKAGIEKAVRESGVKHYTIIRPGWFHPNYFLPFAKGHFPDLSTRGEVVHALDAGLRMPHIAVEDIGKYSAAAMLNPEKFSGHEFNLANENLSFDEAAAVMTRVSGREIKARRRTDEEVEAAKRVVPTQCFQLWLNKYKVEVDGRAIQEKYGIPLMSFEESVVKEKGRLLESLPHL